MEPANQESITVHDHELTSDCDSDGASEREPKDFSKQRMTVLKESVPNEKLYRVTRRNFALSMGFLGKEINVVALHVNAITRAEDEARRHKFDTLSQAVKARLGYANERNLWYGGSRREICDAARFGFGRSYLLNGNGLCLSEMHYPLYSVLRTSEDGEGLRHLLLCRVILGKIETMSAARALQLQVLTDFDSMVDSLRSPTRYCLWHAQMITNTMPYLILSFTAPSALDTLSERMSSASSAPPLHDILPERKSRTFPAKKRYNSS